MIENLIIEDAIVQVKIGKYAYRKGWGECQVIRSAEESDRDFINFEPKGLIVSDCKRRVCDCRVVIYQQTPEDGKAVDWVVVTPEEFNK